MSVDSLVTLFVGAFKGRGLETVGGICGVVLLLFDGAAGRWIWQSSYLGIEDGLIINVRYHDIGAVSLFGVFPMLSGKVR